MKGLQWGGVYTLNQLAKEDCRYVSIVADLFCNYLRCKSELFSPSKRGIPTIVQTIIDVLFVENSIYVNLKLDFSGCTFNNINFKYSIQNCIFYETKFDCCYFKEVISCHFHCSTIVNTEFENIETTSIHHTKFNSVKVKDSFGIFKQNTIQYCDIEDFTLNAGEIQGFMFQYNQYRGYCYIESPIIKNSYFSFKSSDTFMFINSTFINTAINDNYPNISLINCKKQENAHWTN